MGKEQDWRDSCTEVYRVAQLELLEHWRGAQEGEAAFIKEELEESLLDLKQAVIDDRQEDASIYEIEVLRNLAELRDLWENR